MTTDIAYAKPLPALTGLTKEFYGWCRRRELRFQRCARCEAWRHVPRDMCAACGSPEWRWERSSGRGRIFTWTLVARAMHPAFADDVPYAAVVIEMDEGLRVVSQVIDCPVDELAIDTPVQVVFEDVTDDVTLPKFRRVEGR